MRYFAVRVRETVARRQITKALLAENVGMKRVDEPMFVSRQS